MRNALLISLVLMSGCTSLPYSIEDVRVKETYTIKRGKLVGCSLHVKNVLTGLIGVDRKLIPVEDVCGIMECEEKIDQIDSYKCLQFESIREDNSFRRQFERGKTNND